MKTKPPTSENETRGVYLIHSSNANQHTHKANSTYSRRRDTARNMDAQGNSGNGLPIRRLGLVVSH